MNAIFLHPVSLPAVTDAALAELFAAATEKMDVQPLAWDSQVDPCSHVGYVVQLEQDQWQGTLQAVSVAGCSLLPMVDNPAVTLALVGLEILAHGVRPACGA